MFSWFHSGRSLTKPAPEIDDSEFMREFLERNDRACTFRCKVRDAAAKQGIDPIMFDHCSPEFIIAALLLGVKEKSDCPLYDGAPCLGHGDKKLKG